MLLEQHRSPADMYSTRADTRTQDELDYSSRSSPYRHQHHPSHPSVHHRSTDYPEYLSLFPQHAPLPGYLNLPDEYKYLQQGRPEQPPLSHFLDFAPEFRHLQENSVGLYDNISRTFTNHCNAFSARCCIPCQHSRLFGISQHLCYHPRSASSCSSTHPCAAERYPSPASAESRAPRIFPNEGIL